MNRRELLKRTFQVGVTTSTAFATAALATGKPAISTARDKLNDGLAKLEKRVEEMEHHQKKLLRVGAIALAVSTGIDLALIF